MITSVFFSFAPVIPENSLAQGLQQQLSFLGTERVKVELSEYYCSDWLSLLTEGRGGKSGMNYTCFRVKIRYHGKASHAASFPWLGVNALDAAVQCYTNISHLRQQMKSTWRAHGMVLSHFYTSVSFLSFVVVVLVACCHCCLYVNLFSFSMMLKGCCH